MAAPGVTRLALPAHRRAVIVTWIALAGATCVPGVRSLQAQSAPACDPARLQPQGEAEDTLRVLLRRAAGGTRLDPRFALDALDALRRHFRLPARMALPFRVPLTDSTSTLGVVVTAEFLARRDGTVSQARITRTSYVPALDSALLQALDGASVESAFAPFEDDETGDVLALAVDVAFGVEDSTRAGIDAALLRRPRFGRLAMPQVIEPQRLPKFSSARAAGSQIGHATLSFAVSEQGRVLPGTVEFSRVTTRTLAQAMLAQIPSWRFVPARLAGCPVPSLVSQSFRFSFPP